MTPLPNHHGDAPFSARLEAALDSPHPDAFGMVAATRPVNARDVFLSLLPVYDLWTAPLSDLDGREIHQGNPALIGIKAELDAWFVARLDERCPPATVDPDDAVASMRRLATPNLVPPVYDWLAEEASWTQLVHYLALEGGPDGGFDDLVAMAQIGIGGDPKVALAANYWDELGRGDLLQVHTQLHHRLVAATDMPRLPRRQLPLTALERAAMNGLLATNRHLQPEMVGSLGLLEMQAGPRCRAVVKALRRLDAPSDSFPFYEEHAHADPRHGKEWLERVIAPLARQPGWATRMVRGARWRSDVNERFFAEASDCCRTVEPAAA
jgi:hypothetical protein